MLTERTGIVRASRSAASRAIPSTDSALADVPSTPTTIFSGPEPVGSGDLSWTTRNGT